MSFKPSNEYFCPGCADQLGIRPTMTTFDPVGSSCQRENYEKHTIPSSSHPLQTVFDNTSTQYYEDCIREAIKRGIVQRETRGTNVIFCPTTGSAIGSKYKWGKYANQQDTIIVVKTSDPNGVHAFLKASSQYSHQQCAHCGVNILSCLLSPST